MEHQNQDESGEKNTAVWLNKEIVLPTTDKRPGHTTDDGRRTTDHGRRAIDAGRPSLRGGWGSGPAG
jgi:hypothetical protein